jgi:hypothetical protein
VADAVELVAGRQYHRPTVQREERSPPARKGCPVTSDEHAERRQVEEDVIEDVEAEKGSIDSVRVGQDITVNKAKTADKAFNAMDGYIRG